MIINDNDNYQKRYDVTIKIEKVAVFSIEYLYRCCNRLPNYTNARDWILLIYLFGFYLL